MTTNKMRAMLYLTVFAVLLSQTAVLTVDAETEAEIQFTPGEGPTYPVNPEEPGTDGNGGGVEGSLAIVHVSYFDFGSIPVSANTGYYDTTSIQPHIQVVDLRGNNCGWKVLASITRFHDGTNESLPGAVIRITGGRSNSESEAPPPVQNTNAALTSDNAEVLVLNAPVGAGAGHWVMRWYPPENQAQYITLEVPAGTATVGTHTATINWTLVDTP